jgi:hypothetical protein
LPFLTEDGRGAGRDLPASAFSFGEEETFAGSVLTFDNDGLPGKKASTVPPDRAPLPSG